MTTITTGDPTPSTARGRRVRQWLQSWACALLHRRQWYARHTLGGTYYGEAGAEAWRCRKCGRKWKGEG
ncbi:hypothetical protein [Limnoglobus roseus]|uniref:Uncharacterized protein n=1 Tax=Limnoglobus roseus TaxID=2598579 RepID=A0A5C1AIZ1_9BACT|nr:hypothetical protein [Limnoglobus roseus]QEL19409.1 hypothetical protein PX52LOC_06480 [Limnoglobus roseus]